MSNNHQISLQQAIDMTTLYRSNKPSNAPVCETFEADAVNRIISTTGCDRVRIYYGIKENLEIHAILVAVNENDEDILPLTDYTENLNSGDPVIVEDGYRCPPACPPKSPLNQ